MTGCRIVAVAMEASRSAVFRHAPEVPCGGTFELDEQVLPFVRGGLSFPLSLPCAVPRGAVENIRCRFSAAKLLMWSACASLSPAGRETDFSGQSGQTGKTAGKSMRYGKRCGPEGTATGSRIRPYSFSPSWPGACIGIPPFPAARRAAGAGISTDRMLPPCSVQVHPYLCGRPPTPPAHFRCAGAGVPFSGD